MEAFLRDARYAWRGLRRTPGFTLAVVLTLGLALGANTVIFSMVHALVLRPLPFPQSEQLVRLYCVQPEDGDVSPSEPEAAAWSEETRAFSGVAGFFSTSVNRTGGELPERLQAVRTTPNLFSVVGVAPVAGRPFEPADAQPGAAPVALVSHNLATRLFATAGAAAGQTLWLDGTAVRIAGVLPQGFALGDSSKEVEVWLPLLLRTNPEALGHHRLTVLARLKPGVALESARLAAFQRSVPLFSRTGEDGDSEPPHDVSALSWQADVTGRSRPVVFALWGAAAFVLFIACANVANLLLARAMHRRREGAIRSALGASLRHRISETLAESLLLALMGSAVGLLIALWGTDALTAALPPALRNLAAPELHLPVLLFAAGLCVGVAVLLGLVPALDSARIALLPLLSGGHGSTGARHPLRAALVVVQLALALVLLTGAGLLVRTLAQLSEVDLGFHPEGAVSAAVQLPAQRYPDESSRVRVAARLEEALASIPGIRAVGLQREIHLAGSTTSSGVMVEGTDDTGSRHAEHRIASPGAFEALGVPLKRGRLFDATDGQGAALVAVVNEAFVRSFLAGRDPLGSRFSFNSTTWWTVVGIVGDVRHIELTEAPGPAFYLPVAQTGPEVLNLIVRGSPEPTLAQVRSVVKGVDPELPVPTLQKLDALVARGKQRYELLLNVLSALSGLALLLAALGIWGVMSYSVTQRTRELSIRRALGATERNLVRLVVGAAGRLVGFALLVGLPAAVGLGQVARGLLYGVTPTDVPTLLGVAALLGMVGLIAAWLPARRAARVDPGLTLRSE
ncbi:ABC transporter permease [Hyalangium versicolor]|uniref:ABC transporter permease n=1 Tax=Hyalangium versicolor TaxID=2861190 RepID=UPI001CCB5D54|nr:ABC transporter permease [Hyalangium versicolor]